MLYGYFKKYIIKVKKKNYLKKKSKRVGRKVCVKKCF